MRKFICLLLALCLMAPFAMAEEDEDELSLSDWMDMPAGQEQSADDVPAEDEAAEQLEPDGSQLITATFTGDFTIGGDSRKRTDIFNDELKKQGGDINFPLRNVRDILMADDLTLVNFEGTLTDSTYVPNNKKENQFLFSAPPEYVSILADNGIEAVALENNHVMDHGKAGYQDTCDTLSAAGVAYSGHLGASTFTTETGVKIGMLAYQTFNGNYKNIYAAIEGDIKALRDAGCALVVVSYHWGEEKDYVPNERQVPLGRATIDAGADLVIGHHSHRMNPIEVYKGKYICYSLGNFSFAGNGRPDDMDTYIFQQRFRVYPDGTVENADMRIIPCSISSQENVNDFKPTPKDADGAAALLARLDKLNAQFEKAFAKTGVTAVSPYPTAWTYAY